MKDDKKMEVFSVENVDDGYIINVDKMFYIARKIDPNTLIKKTVNDDKGIIKDDKGIIVKNGAGVYLFVISNDVKRFNCKSFNKEVTGIFRVSGKFEKHTVGVPPFNFEKTKRINLGKDYLFYVGNKKKDVLGRIKEHWNKDKITNTVSLKLGFKSRKFIKKSLDVYVILESDNDSINSFDGGNIEKKIRDRYGTYFGN